MVSQTKEDSGLSIETNLLAGAKRNFSTKAGHDSLK
jgi:hypothetical protein